MDALRENDRKDRCLAPDMIKDSIVIFGCSFFGNKTRSESQKLAGLK